jgi:hypothetical protein
LVEVKRKHPSRRNTFIANETRAPGNPTLAPLALRKFSSM